MRRGRFGAPARFCGCDSSGTRPGIESRSQRLSVPNLMEYVTEGDREELEAYVDEVSGAEQVSIFWEVEQGLTMRRARPRHTGMTALPTCRTWTG